jgi:hypothetical protein
MLLVQTSAVALVQRFPDALFDLLVFATMGAVGQLVIFYNIREFGSVASTTITVTRSVRVYEKIVLDTWWLTRMWLVSRLVAFAHLCSLFVALLRSTCPQKVPDDCAVCGTVWTPHVLPAMVGCHVCVRRPHHGGHPQVPDAEAAAGQDQEAVDWAVAQRSDVYCIPALESGCSCDCEDLTR